MKKIIFLISILSYSIISNSCVNEDKLLNDMNKPCVNSWQGLKFNEVNFYIELLGNNTPTEFSANHPNQPFDLYSILNEGTGQNLDESFVRISIDGVCDGDNAITKISHSDNQEYDNSNKLFHVKCFDNKFTQEIDMSIYSRVYLDPNGKKVRCLWKIGFKDNPSVEIPKRDYFLFEQEDITGSWIAIDKSQFNNEPRRVYVHNTFNNYTYNL